MNPFQSIANYLDNDLYRWENDEERKRRYDEMYPMGDAHLGTWDELSRERVRRNLAPGFQHWDEGAEDTGPAGYDASVQENVLETITKKTPTGTTITKKLAPTPERAAYPGPGPRGFTQSERSKPYPIARGLGPYDEHTQGVSPVGLGGPRGMRTVNKYHRLAEGPMPPPGQSTYVGTPTYAGPGARGFTPPPPPSPDVAYPFEGRQGMSMRQGADTMHALEVRDALANQKAPSPNPIYPYEGSQGGPMFDPNIVGPAAEHIRALQAASPSQPMPYEGGNVSGAPTPPMPVQPNLGPRITQGGITGQEQHRISRRPQYGNQAYRSWTLPELSLSEDRPSMYSREQDRGGLSMGADYPAPITNDAYTDAVIDFVGRDAEADERGMGDWYSQMAREAIRKFNGLPADEAVTPVYKRKASGPSKRTKNKRTTSKSKKKQRSRGKRY